MRRERFLILAAAGLAALVLVAFAAMLWPTGRTKAKKAAPAPRCVPWPPLPAELICGQNVIWTNPDGSRISIGKVANFRGIPRPKPDLNLP